MPCPACAHADLDLSPNGAYARCPACGGLFMVWQGTLRPVEIPAGMDEALFLQGIGLGGPDNPPPPDPATAAREAMAQAAEDHVRNTKVRMNVGGVKLDVGAGGVDLHADKALQRAKDKVTGKVTGWIIGCVATALIVGIMVVVVAAVAILVATSM